MARNPGTTKSPVNKENIGETVQCEFNTLEDIFIPGHKYCFLAGSGISLAAPSCLPTGKQFTGTLLDICIPKSESTEILGLMDPERKGMRNSGDFLRFEELMEYLSQSVDPELHILDEYANCRTPNFNHHFLAQMIIQEHPVLTTNFDSLIEIALLEAGVQPDQICPTIFQHDWEPSNYNKRHVVYKLHGSLNDVRTNQSCRESIQATLKQISLGKNELLQLEYWKRLALKPLLQNYDLVVMGYSGLDDFDLLPTLMNISSDTNIIWINHVPGHSPSTARINSLRELDSSTNTKEGDPRRIWRLLSGFSQSESRLPAHIICINLDTMQFSNWMWGRFLNSPLPQIKVEPVNKKSKKPPLTLSPVDQWLLAGKIYNDRNLQAEGLRAYQTALTIAKAEGAREKMGKCFIGIGLLLHILGKTKQAKENDLHALKVAESCHDHTTMATMLNEIGMDAFNERKFKEAEKMLQQALKVSRQLEDRHFEALTLNNWGLFEWYRGNFKKAKDFYNETAAINDQLGDLRAKAINYLNLGLLCQAQHSYGEAIQKYRQVIEIAEKLGALITVTKALNSIGQILEAQGEIMEAFEYYEHALQISQKIENPHLRLRCLISLAELHYKLRQVDEAFDYYEQLMEIPDQLEDSDMKKSLAKASLLARMGVIYHYKNRMNDSLKAFEDSLALYNKFDPAAGKCTALTQFAFLLDDIGQKSKAIQLLKEARVIAKALRDPGLLKIVMDMQEHVFMGR